MDGSRTRPRSHTQGDLWVEGLHTLILLGNHELVEGIFSLLKMFKCFCMVGQVFPYCARRCCIAGDLSW